jgi:hypothetical protein
MNNSIVGFLVLVGGGVCLGQERTLIVQRRKAIVAIAFSLMMVTSGLILLVTPGAKAASDKDSWDGYFPIENACLNQTLSTYNSDNYVTAALSANLWQVQNNSKPGERSVWVTVDLTANSRKALRYNGEFNMPGYMPASSALTGTLTGVTDDCGIWVGVTGGSIFYYGGWYKYVYISSNGFASFKGKSAINPDGSVSRSNVFEYTKNANPTFTGPVPKSIPNSAEPNDIVAPLWRDLDPSKAGTIKYGYLKQTGTGSEGDYFWIKWDGVRNYADTKTQTFAIAFPLNDEYKPVYFVYLKKGITTGVPTSIGMEDIKGATGCSYSSPPSVSSATRSIILHPDTETSNFNPNVYTIRNVWIYAAKYSGDTGTNNDPNAYVTVEGHHDGYPGGVNVELSEPGVNGLYMNNVSGWAATGTVLGVLSLVAPFPADVLLGVAGLACDAYAANQEWSPAMATYQNSVKTSTEPAKLLAHTLNPAKEENTGHRTAFDVGALPGFWWRIADNSVGSSTHRLVIWAELEIQYPTAFTYQVPSTFNTYRLKLDAAPIDLKMKPSGQGNVDWLGRTNPDGKFYSLTRLSSSSLPPALVSEVNQYRNSPTSPLGGYDYGYHLDSIGDANSGYDMIGWHHLESSTTGEFRPRTDGTILVEGYFKQIDTMSTGDTRRCSYVYAIPWNPERPFDAVPAVGSSKTLRVLNMQDTNWVFARGTMSTGLLGNPPQVVKIGVGRTDYGSNSEAVEWAGVRVFGYNGYGSSPGNEYALSISTTAGGTTYYKTSGGSIDRNANTPRAYSWILHSADSTWIYAEPLQGYAFDHWELRDKTGSWVPKNNPIMIENAANNLTDRTLAAVFVPTIPLTIITSPGCPQPIAGTYYYGYGGWATFTAVQSYFYGSNLYTFWRWYDPQVITFDLTKTGQICQPQTWEAQYTSQPAVRLDVSGPPGCTSPTTGTWYYAPGTTAGPFVASPLSYNYLIYHYQFNYWKLDGSIYSYSQSVTVLMDANHVLVASYTKTPI